MKAPHTPPVKPIDLQQLKKDATQLATELLPSLRQAHGTVRDSAELGQPRRGGGGHEMLSRGRLFAMDVATGAAQQRSALEQRLFSRSVPIGLAGRATEAALERLLLLIEYACGSGRGDDAVVRESAQWLHSAARVGRRLVDRPEPGDEPWTKAPGDLVCPNCHNPLYLPPNWSDEVWSDGTVYAAIYCRECRDDGGKRLRWAASEWLGLLQDEPEPEPLAEWERELIGAAS